MWYFPNNFVPIILAAALPHWFLIPLAIIIGALVLEDLTTILVGIMAADGLINPALALFSLFVGVILGDYGLYFLGMLAKNHPRIRRFVEHERLLKFREGLERNLRHTVISTRFIPGLRIPTYVACGFFHMPFGKFARSVIIATLIWTTLLFGGAYIFGQSTEGWLGVWRWPIALLIVVAIAIQAYFVRKRANAKDA